MKVSTLKMHHEHHPMRPTRQIAISFLAVILIGSVLLMLPICNNTTPTAYLNNLFIATSATCVTGLVPVVTSEQFNILGQIVIIILIQMEQLKQDGTKKVLHGTIYIVMERWQQEKYK